MRREEQRQVEEQHTFEGMGFDLTQSGAILTPSNQVFSIERVDYYVSHPQFSYHYSATNHVIDSVWLEVNADSDVHVLRIPVEYISDVVNDTFVAGVIYVAESLNARQIGRRLCMRFENVVRVCNEDGIIMWLIPDVGCLVIKNQRLIENRLTLPLVIKWLAFCWLKRGR